MREKVKLFKELDKIRKELEKKTEAEKAKKTETEKMRNKVEKLSEKSGASPEPTGVSVALEEKKLAENEQLYVTLRNENEVSGYNHHLSVCIDRCSNFDQKLVRLSHYVTC